MKIKYLQNLENVTELDITPEGCSVSVRVRDGRNFSERKAKMPVRYKISWPIFGDESIKDAEELVACLNYAIRWVKRQEKKAGTK